MDGVLWYRALTTPPPCPKVSQRNLLGLGAWKTVSFNTGEPFKKGDVDRLDRRDVDGATMAPLKGSLGVLRARV
jgi:hypothetical protein